MSSSKRTFALLKTLEQQDDSNILNSLKSRLQAVLARLEGTSLFSAQNAHNISAYDRDTFQWVSDELQNPTRPLTMQRYQDMLVSMCAIFDTAQDRKSIGNIYNNWAKMREEKKALPSTSFRRYMILGGAKMTLASLKAEVEKYCEMFTSYMNALIRMQTDLSLIEQNNEKIINNDSYLVDQIADLKAELSNARHLPLTAVKSKHDELRADFQVITDLINNHNRPEKMIAETSEQSDKKTPAQERSQTSSTAFFKPDGRPKTQLSRRKAVDLDRSIPPGILHKAS